MAASPCCAPHLTPKPRRCSCTPNPIPWFTLPATQYWDPCPLLQPQSREPVPETDACLMLSNGHLPSWASVSRFSTLGHPKPQKQPVLSGKSHPARLEWALHTGDTVQGGGPGFQGHISPCQVHL